MMRQTAATGWRVVLAVGAVTAWLITERRDGRAADPLTGNAAGNKGSATAPAAGPVHSTEKNDAAEKEPSPEPNARLPQKGDGPEDFPPGHPLRAFPSPAEKEWVRLEPALSYSLSKKQARIQATVVLREGPLELFLCPTRTKEHESILSAPFTPRALQFAMLIIGAKPGSPARHDPPKPPTGQKVRIWVEWKENGESKRVEAQSWVRDVKSRQAMSADFVFTGSGLRKVPGAERPIFLADDGDVVCLANFPGSLIDVDIRSSKENADLAFEAFTERIPPKGTAVTIIFEPVF